MIDPALDTDAAQPAPTPAAEAQVDGLAAMGFDVDEPDMMVPCMYCKIPTAIVGGCIAMIRSWNRKEARKVGELGDLGIRYKPDLIRLSEVIPCDACIPRKRAEIAGATLDTSYKARLLLNQIRAGSGLEPDEDAVAWLVENGYKSSLEAARLSRKAIRLAPTLHHSDRGDR
jgi:hypothetical protein